MSTPTTQSYPNPIHLKKKNNNHPISSQAKQKQHQITWHLSSLKDRITLTQDFPQFTKENNQNPEEDWTGLKFPKLGELIIFYLPIPMEIY